MNFSKNKELITFEDNGLKLIFKEIITDFDKRSKFYKKNNKQVIYVHNKDLTSNDLFSILLRLKKIISEENIFFKKLELPLNIKVWSDNTTFLNEKINNIDLLLINYFDDYVMFYVTLHGLLSNDLSDDKIKNLLKEQLDNTGLYINIGGTDILILDLKQKKLVGCALKTDLETRLLGDVIISKKYQKKGFFKLIIQELLTKYPEIKTSRIDGPLEPFLKLGFKLNILSPFLELKTFNNAFNNKRWSDINSAYINHEMLGKKGYFEVRLNKKENRTKIKAFLKKEFNAETKFITE